MYLNIQIDLSVLKTYDKQLTLTTKKSLHITFNLTSGLVLSFFDQYQFMLLGDRVTCVNNLPTDGS